MRSLTWFITGTTSGFGRRLVQSALTRGDKVVATARCPERLNSLKSQLDSRLLPNLHTMRLDVTQSLPEIQRTVDNALEKCGKIDVLVNNAGIGYPSLIEESASTITEKTYNVNVFGTINVTTAVLPSMRERQQGTVVVIGSRSAWKTCLPGMSAYCSSKAAIHAWADTLDVELKPFNIRTLVVAPGAFRTEGIMSNFAPPNKALPEYDTVRRAILERFRTTAGTQSGDPVKAMEALVDVVKGEGLSKNRGWPKNNYLLLGKDAEFDVRSKCMETLAAMEDWFSISRNVDYN